MLTTKFLVTAAATIATAGVIGVAIAQQTANQDQKNESAQPPVGSTSAATPAVPAPSATDSSSSASSSTGAVGSAVTNDSMAKTDRN